MRNLILPSLALSLAVVGNACKNKTTSKSPATNSPKDSPASGNGDSTGVPVPFVPPRPTGPAPSDKPMPEAMKLKLEEVRTQSDTAEDLSRRLTAVYDGIGDVAFESGLKEFDSPDFTSKIAEVQTQSQSTAKSLAEFESAHGADSTMAAHLAEFKKAADKLQSNAASVLEYRIKTLSALVMRIEKETAKSQELLQEFERRAKVAATVSSELQEIADKLKLIAKKAQENIESAVKLAVRESMTEVQVEIERIRLVEKEREAALIKKNEEIAERAKAEDALLTKEFSGFKADLEKSNSAFQLASAGLNANELSAKDTNKADRLNKLTQFTTSLKSMEDLLNLQKETQEKIKEAAALKPTPSAAPIVNLLNFTVESYKKNSLKLTELQTSFKNIPKQWAENVLPSISRIGRMVSEVDDFLKQLEADNNVVSVAEKVLQLESMLNKIQAEPLTQIVDDIEPVKNSASFIADKAIFSNIEKEVSDVSARISGFPKRRENVKPKTVDMYLGQLGELKEKVAKLAEAMKATQVETLLTVASVLLTEASTLEQTFATFVDASQYARAFFKGAVKFPEFESLDSAVRQRMTELKIANEAFQKLMHEVDVLKNATSPEALNGPIKDFEKSIATVRGKVKNPSDIYAEMAPGKSIFNLIQQARLIQLTQDMLQEKSVDISEPQKLFSIKKEDARSAAFRNFDDWCNDFPNLPAGAKSTIKVLMGIALPAKKNDDFNLDNCTNAARFITKFSTVALSNYGISDITVLGSLPKAKDIYLNNNNVTDITPLEFSSNVEILALSQNLLSNSTGTFLSLRALKRVYLTDNKNISDISSLRNAFNLQFLGLSGNSITDISSLSKLNNLQVLGLAENKVQDISPLFNLKSLTKLSLNRNEIKSAAGLESIKTLATEHSLDLRNNPLESKSCPLPRTIYCKMK